MSYEEIYNKLTEDFPQGAYNVDRSRGFQLIGIRAAYVTERLTQVFGMLGHGWRYAHSPFEIVEREVITEVALQYRLDEGGTYPYYWDTVTEAFVPDREAEAIWSEPILDSGGNQIGKGGVPMSDARKSALSGALSKAASRIGVGISAYKGHLEIDGEKVVVKEDSGASPSDTQKAARQLMSVIFSSAPDQYDKLLAAGNTVTVAYHNGMLKQLLAVIDGANLREFVSDNLQTLVGREGAVYAQLRALEIKRLNDIVKSIAAGTLDWKQALEVASTIGVDESWKDATADFLDSVEDDTESDDDS